MQLDDEDRAVLAIISKAGSRGIKSRHLGEKHVKNATRTTMQTAHRLRSMKLVTMTRAVSGDNWVTTDRGEAVL